MEDAERLAEAAARALAHRPAGLISDIDGTISRIAPTPESATVHPAARDALARLARALDVVALVSGRGADDAARMVGLDDVLYVGNHGMEARAPGSQEVVVSQEAAPYLPVIAEVLATLAATLPIEGLLFENKGATASIHYRLAPDPASAESTILAAARPLAERHGLRLTRGRMVVEIRPPVRRDKGTAVREIVASYRLASAVFLGDDTTDLDAIRAIRALRNDGAIRGLAIGIVSPEGPQAIAELADGTVEGVDGCVAFLVALAARVEAR